MPGILDILNVIGTVVDRVIPDPKQKAELQLELAKLADQEASRSHDEMMGQIATNTAEAQNRSVFVAGWRPFIGWGCGASLVYSTLVAPLFHLNVPDLSFLQTVLMAMLGVGAMRSYDKAKGTANDVLPIFTPKTVEAGQPVAPLARRKKFLGIF
jgi:hypothetical protein